MVQFKPSGVNSKIFLVDKSEVQKRFDPFYYSHEFNKYEQEIKKRNFKRFKDLILSINNGFDLRDYKLSGTPYLKVANIKKGEFDFSKIQYVEIDSSEISKNIQLKKDNLILTRKGTFGNALLLEKDYDFVISSEVFYIEIFQDLINPKFIEIFFNSKLGQLQFDKVKIGAIMGSLSQEAIKELIIPIPDCKTQTDIIKIWNKNKEIAKKYKVEATQKLASIDNYLLDILEVRLPEKRETIQDRIFIVSSPNIIGKRLDPNAYKLQVQNLKKSVINSSFPKKKLKQLVSKGSGGSWGTDIVSDFDDDKFVCCTVIRATEFDNKGNLRFIDGKVKQRLIEKKVFEKIKLNFNDIILEKSGGSENQPVGRVAIIDTETSKYTPLIHSNFVHKFSIVSDEIIPEYLFYYLNLMHKIKLTESMQSQTNGIRNLIMSEYFSQDVIVPPIEVQNEIIIQIQKIRNEAKKLEDEANLVLEHAKQEIEKMILGEVV